MCVFEKTDISMIPNYSSQLSTHKQKLKRISPKNAQDRAQKQILNQGQ